MKELFDSTIKNYKHYFGATKKPVIWEVGPRDGDEAVYLAESIYDGSEDWFWVNATILLFSKTSKKQISKKFPEIEFSKVDIAKTEAPAYIDILKINSAHFTLRGLDDVLRRVRILHINVGSKGDSIKESMRLKGWILVDSREQTGGSIQVWLNSDLSR